MRVLSGIGASIAWMALSRRIPETRASRLRRLSSRVKKQRGEGGFAETARETSEGPPSPETFRSSSGSFQTLWCRKALAQSAEPWKLGQREFGGFSCREPKRGERHPCLAFHQGHLRLDEAPSSNEVSPSPERTAVDSVACRSGVPRSADGDRWLYPLSPRTQ